MEFLDPLSYVRLTTTNRHFYSLRDDNGMADALFDLEKEWPDYFIDHEILPCYGCCKVVYIGDLAMVDCWTLYGNALTQHKYDAPNRPCQFRLAAGGRSAEDRRCNACADASCGEYEKFARALDEFVQKNELKGLLTHRGLEKEYWWDRLNGDPFHFQCPLFLDSCLKAAIFDSHLH